MVEKWFINLVGDKNKEGNEGYCLDRFTMNYLTDFNDISVKYNKINS